MDNKKFKDSTTSILFTHEIKDKEEQYDENINRILFKNYEIKTKVGKSTTIQIYEGTCLSNNTPVTIKLESRSNTESYLELEVVNLYTFKDLGIPKLITSGKTKKYIVLIEEKLGPSLHKLFIDNKRKFSLNEICCIGIQCFERLKGIHSKNYIYRNIKPENFKIGLNDPNVIYLQNFYLCEKYKSDTTNKHAKLTLSNKIVGTQRYGSIDALKGLRQGRKDDLESLCYMLIYFFLGKLPWQDIKAETEAEKYKKLLNEKKKFNIDNYDYILPKDFRTMFKLIKNLKFDETPKYSLYIRLLQNIRKENQCFDPNDFYWVNEKNIKIKKRNIKSKKEGGFRERLMEKIKIMRTEQIPIHKYNNKNNNEDNDVNNDFQSLGNIYIEDDLSDNDSYNGKTDIQLKLSKRYLDVEEEEKEENNKIRENIEKNMDNHDILNDSISSNSSIDTRVYNLNDDIKTFIKINNEEINDINNKLDNINDKQVKQEINISNTNSIKEKNKLNDIIEENIEEENSIENTPNNEQQEKKEVDSSDNNDKYIMSGSLPNTKSGSVSISNIKESKTKGNNETPSLIIIKKNSEENGKSIKDEQKEKTTSVPIDNKKNENRFGQIKGPEFDIKINSSSKSGKKYKNKDKDKDCKIF